MPRTGWRKAESDRRLPDLVSVGLLSKVFPAEVVDAVITECGRTEQRRRSLPARSMAYLAMGMALHSEGSYEDVLALICDGLAWAHRDERSGKLANKAANPPPDGSERTPSMRCGHEVVARAHQPASTT